MTWKQAHRDDLSELVVLLKKQEWGCVAFSDRLKETGFVSLPGGRDKVYVSRANCDGRIDAALYVGWTGLIFPVFDTSRIDTDAPYAGSTVVDSFPTGRVTLPRGCLPSQVYSIMGTDGAVRKIEDGLRREPTHRIQYYLMTLSASKQIDCGGTRELRPPQSEVRLRTASIDDIDRLFPLQKRYEREEVLLPGHRLNAAQCYGHLREILERETVVVAEHRNKIVAKANTNARGFRYDQVGGVFTERRYRNQGIATLLMRHLVRGILSRSKGVALFVKKDNRAALSLYHRLGFETRDDFTITYYV